MSQTSKRNIKGFSLIETMTIIAVIGIVLGLLYAYSQEGWKLFYQSYSRGLSQVKAKTAIRAIAEELREANKSRVTISRGTSFGVPLPDDVQDSSPYIYFTKPKAYEPTGDVIGYDYVLFYFAKPKEAFEVNQLNRRKAPPKERFSILKSIKFLNQSKYYTEDVEKTWPFLPPILEIQKSTLQEDEIFIESIKQAPQESEGEEESTLVTSDQQNKKLNQAGQELFLDHFARLKKESRNIPISGNFQANSLSDPFTAEEVNIFFGQDWRGDKPIKIKVSIEESPLLFGLMSAMSEFELVIAPRN